MSVTSFFLDEFEYFLHTITETNQKEPEYVEYLLHVPRYNGCYIPFCVYINK